MHAMHVDHFLHSVHVVQVSVPDGATNSRGTTDSQKAVPEPHADKQFAFLWASREIIDAVSGRSSSAAAPSA